MRKKFSQKRLTSLENKDDSLEEKELNKQLGRKVRIKIRNLVCRQSHVKRVAIKIGELNFFARTPKREKIHDLLSSASIKSRKMRGLNLGRILKKGKMVAALTLLAFFIINMFLLTSIIGQTSTKTSLQSYGSIRTIGVGVYTNGYCTTTVSTVDWGQITPGQAISRTFYLRNEGSSDVTLTMFATNWTPSTAENYMSVDWDYAGQTLSPNQVIAVTFTLSVQSTISGIETFNFNIDIIGAG